MWPEKQITTSKCSKHSTQYLNNTIKLDISSKGRFSHLLRDCHCLLKHLIDHLMKRRLYCMVELKGIAQHSSGDEMTLPWMVSGGYDPLFPTPLLNTLTTTFLPHTHT